MLKLEAGVDGARVGRVMESLLRHHDGLRLRFRPDGRGGWRQENAGREEGEGYRYEDLRGRDGEEGEQRGEACRGSGSGEGGWREHRGVDAGGPGEAGAGADAGAAVGGAAGLPRPGPRGAADGAGGDDDWWEPDRAGEDRARGPRA